MTTENDRSAILETMLQLIQAKSLSLPRKVTSAMRESLRNDPTKALRFGPLVPHLANLMVRSYREGYSKRGDPFKRSRRQAKQNEYLRLAREVLNKYQVSTNKELKRIYREAVSRGTSHSKAVKLVLRRFRALGVDAPATTRLEALFRSASNSTYHEGIWDADRLDPSVWGFRFHAREVKGEKHPTTRESHYQYHLVCLPKDHPFWERVFPPLSWNCYCRIQTLRRKQKLVHPPTPELEIEAAFRGQKFELR